MEVNINREVEDTFYRYKMPKLAAKVEGKGNGIKTVIVNVTDIAKALYRKPIYVTKYFGCELGAQVYVDEKNDRYIVNGAHEASKLQEILDGFIKKFVLCQECHNPETSLRVKKKAGIVSTTCKACGAQGMLDVGHRLTQYIIKNPPEGDTTTSGKKSSKKGKKSGDHESGDDENVNGDERHSPNFQDSRADDDDWGEDTTEEAQIQRMNELSAMAKSLALSVDVEKTESERADIFFKHVTKLHRQGEVESKSKEIQQEADRLNLGARIVMVLAEVLLSNPQTITTDINKYRLVFMSFTRNAVYGQRAQQYLLGAMCKLIEQHVKDNLVRRACHILKTFYDSDIIEEETIIGWYDKGPSKKFVAKELSSEILKTCAPMVNWLKEAEEEESDGDEENEQDDDEFDSPSPAEPKSMPKSNGVSKAAAKPDESDDDIDIDAI